MCSAFRVAKLHVEDLAVAVTVDQEADMSTCRQIDGLIEPFASCRPAVWVLARRRVTRAGLSLFDDVA
jgi:hypothetical protein